MRSHWMLVFSMRPRTLDDWRKLPLSAVYSSLIWNPEDCHVGSIDEHALLFAASSNSKLFKIDRPYSVDGNSGLVFAGLPTLEELSSSNDRDIAAVLKTSLRKSDQCELHQKLGGTWSIAEYGNKKITAFSDFSGFNSVFYTKGNGIVAISNKAGLLRPIADRSKQIFTGQLDPIALSWLPGTTMIQGHATAYSGVKKVPPGYYCTIDKKGLRISRHATTYFDPIDLEGRVTLEQFVEARSSVLAKRAEWYFKRGLKLASHLTGGKDSRTMLAVLKASGLVSSLEQITTVGEEDSGDVIIARQITNELGLDDQHDVRPRGKSARSRPLSDVKRGFAHSIAKYDGQLTAYDGAQKPLSRFPSVSFFTGAGGEIYRPKSYRSFENLGQAYTQFVNWSATHDSLGILNRPTRVLQRHQIRQRVRQMLESKIDAQHTKYYIDHRLSNWGCGHWQGSAGNQIPFLLDLDLSRLLFRKQEFGETIHYLIIKSLAPDLLRIPFFRARWTGPTRKLAEDDGFDLDPLDGEVSKGFPWQFDFYREYGEALIRDLRSKSLGPFQFSVDRNRLSHASIAMDADSAQIKSLFSLVTGRELANIATLRDPDTPDQVTTFSGNLVSGFNQLGRGNAADYAESLFDV